MKKLLLGLGTLTAVVAPVATVVACGSTTPDKTPPVTPPVKSASGKEVVLTIDISGVKSTDTDKINYLAAQYDQYAKLMTVDSVTRLRPNDVKLIMIDSDYITTTNPTGSYSYVSFKKPSDCKMPDPMWEHLVALLEDITGKPSVADLILDE